MNEAKIERIDTDKQKIEFDLDFHMSRLLDGDNPEPFFARISRYVSKVPTYSIPTAGVTLNTKSMSYELLYNPKFFASLTWDQILCVLMHEYYHIALMHVTTRKKPDIHPYVQNIAADLAINSLPIMYNKNGDSRLPSFCCLPGVGQFAQYPKEQSFEWYLAKIIKDAKELDPNQLLDDHDGWMNEEDMNESDSGAKQAADAKIREVLKKAIEDTEKECREGNSKAWGSVSAKIRKEINDAVYHRLDPKSIFKYFCKTSVKSTRKHRITKINRRWAYVHPGRAWERRARIAIAIDESGSVSDKMLSLIFGWMGELSQYCEFTVVPFDSEVYTEHVYTWKKGEKRKSVRVLAGGTDFNAPTDWANKNNIDALIIFTDLCAPKPKKCNVPRLWLTDSNNARRPYFTTTERILSID